MKKYFWEDMDFIYRRKILMSFAKSYNVMTEYWQIYREVKNEIGDKDEILFTEEIRKRLNNLITKQELRRKSNG
tara:strand:+ start:1261 stop:1482 length:222 start_codon:yes stop_codon:yes gene_type:complete